MVAPLQIYAKTGLWRSQVIERFAGFPSIRLAGGGTYDPPSIPAGGSTSTTVTVTGALPGQETSAAFAADLMGLILSAYTSAPDTVTVVLFNPTAGAIDLDENSINAWVWVD